MQTEKWPTEVWAVEYTTIGDKRIVTVMADRDSALLFASQAHSADPLLLRSYAEFSEVE
jgi:hypothetical protein